MVDFLAGVCSYDAAWELPMSAKVYKHPRYQSAIAREWLRVTHGNRQTIDSLCRYFLVDIPSVCEIYKFTNIRQLPPSTPPDKP